MDCSDEGALVLNTLSPQRLLGLYPLAPYQSIMPLLALGFALSILLLIVLLELL